MLAARNWGDGATTRSRHIIRDVQFGEAASAILCEDGTIIRGPTPEDVERQWQDHGGKAMYVEAEERVEREPLFDVDRSSAAMRIVAAIGMRCSCSPGSDITLCPNYTPLDEEGDDL